MDILSIDIGGTKTAAARFAWEGEVLRQVCERASVAKNESFSNPRQAIEWAVHHCMGGKPAPDAIVLGVAGPVTQGAVRMTNLGWTIHSDGVSEALGGAHALVCNDFELVAMSLPALAEADLECLYEPVEPRSPGLALVVGAGTGLGHAWSLQDGTVIASEAGHADLADISALPVSVLNRLHELGGRLTAETALSGSGLANIHAALAGLAHALAATEVVALALDGDAHATSAVNVFCEVLGSHIGNLCLAAPGLRGVYLTGGVIGGLRPYLGGDRFSRAMHAKPPMEALLRRIPFFHIRREYPALLGGARLAVDRFASRG